MILLQAGYEQSPLPEVKNELDFPQTEEALPLTHLSLETDVTHKRINAEEAIGSLAKNKNIQLATSLDESTLKKRLSIAWNPENALHDCRCAILVNIYILNIFVYYSYRANDNR